MARVEYRSTPVGVLLDRAGNARSGVTVTHSGTAPFAGSTGPTAYGGALTTNADGEVPGWLDPGVYAMTDPTTGKTYAFEVGGAATTTNEPSTTEKAALAGSSGTPSGSNKYVTDADSRNTDARVPVLTVGAVQAGVLAAADFKVTQRAAGANQSVDVAGSTLAGGGALVRETATGRLRYVTQATATVNLPVGPAHATLPRIDKVYVTTAGVLGYVEGTATGGATLDNMTGQPATPSDALLIGALLRPAATNNVTTGNMRDRRPWAGGAWQPLIRTANAAAGSDYVFAINTALTVIDSTNLRRRFECTGNAMRVTLSGTMFLSATNANVALSVLVDSAVATGAAAGLTEHFSQAGASAGAGYLGFHYSYPVTPAAGSRLIEPGYMSSTASNSVLARASVNLTWTVEEIVRAKTDNT